MRPALVVFAGAALAQWLLPLSGVWQHERVIARGRQVSIECEAPDPYDMLRGRYLAVRPRESSVATPDGFPAGGGVVPVWATLDAAGEGPARINKLSLTPVSGPTVIRLAARSIGFMEGTPTVRLQWPFDRFYLNERLAPDADRLVAGKTTVAEVRLLDGQAVLTDILLDGVSVRELVKRQAAAQP